MADFESPSGGKLPGTATHQHWCYRCQCYVFCGERSCSTTIQIYAQIANGDSWGYCCACEAVKRGLGGLVGRKTTRDSEIIAVFLGPTAEVVFGTQPREMLGWLAHELAKELLRQEGIDPAKGRW